MTNFDPGKRQTLITLAGLSATPLLAGMPVIADDNTALAAPNNTGDILDCTLISRADNARSHLLMHNRTDNIISVSQFMPQLIEFDDTLMSLEDAYSETFVIPSQDRVMVRLNVEAGPNKKTPYNTVIHLNARTRYLPQGTRVVKMAVRVNNGICLIDNNPAQV